MRSTTIVSAAPKPRRFVAPSTRSTRKPMLRDVGAPATTSTAFVTAAQDASDTAPDEVPVTGTSAIGVPAADAVNCHSDDAAGCFLSHDQRQTLLMQVAHVVQSSMANFHAAILGVRLDRKLQDNGSGGWGFLAEFLFASISGPLIGAALKGFKNFRKAVSALRDANELAAIGFGSERPIGAVKAALARVSPDMVATLLGSASKGLRGKLKNAAHSDGDSTPSWDVFLTTIQDGIKPLEDDIGIVQAAQADDAGLVALDNTYLDPQAHSVTEYKAYMNDMLGRFDAEGVSKVGTKFEDGGSVRAIHIEAYGQTRVGILVDHGTDYTGKSESTPYGPIPLRGTGEQRLLSLVDDDLVDYALSVSGAAAPTETVQVTEEHAPFHFAPDDRLLSYGNPEHRYRAWVHQAHAAQSNTTAARTGDAANDAATALVEVF
ncbi:MAG: hypothetical protein H6709_10200 [Kofleriaceae bacterium]|nr:hypothetical protein [Kofleriaceae bacterium]MCB9572446.1 hypothetical protein [Kofleriaceae bacterium]